MKNVRSLFSKLEENTRTIFARSALCLGIIAISGPTMTGCAFSKRYQDLPTFWPYDVFDSENQSVGRFKTSYIADQIHAYFRGNISGPIAVATFVDLDNLYATSTFGRMVGEQILSELAMKGYNVREIRQSEALQVMFEQGEFGLSRDLRQLRQAQDLAGIVVGTYTVSPVRVYINARLIDPATSLVLSAATVEMSKTDEMAKMLRNNSMPTAMERIPVRSIGWHTHPMPNFRSMRVDPMEEDNFDVKPKAPAAALPEKRAQLVETPEPRL